MKVPAADILVHATTGVDRRDGRFLPFVQLTVTVEGQGQVTAILPPDKSRSVGLDLIAAAAHASSDAAIRALAKADGLDGDTLILRFRELADIPPDG